MSIRRKLGLIFMLAVLLAYTVQPLISVSAAPESGIYSANYVVKKAEDESVSMANDYFEKPAQLTVSGGTTKVRLQLNHSGWITEFQVPGGNVKVLSSNKTADTRVVEFEVKDVSEPVIAKIHVTVPSIDYDHDYTVRFVFEADKLKAATPAATKKPVATPAATKKPAAKPVATKKPVVKPVATKKPAATPAATKKPAAKPAPSKKSVAELEATKVPTAIAAAATQKPAATVKVVSDEALAVAPEQEQRGISKVVLGSGAALVIAAAGYAVIRFRKK